MKSPQFELFFEDVYSALKTCVAALGGAKVVGCNLWGDSQPAHKQAEKLNNCLNSNHKQKLSLVELLWLLREAKKIGCHAGVYFICTDTGYSEPQALSPEDQRDFLQRQFIASVGDLKVLANQIKSLNGSSS